MISCPLLSVAFTPFFYFGRTFPKGGVGEVVIEVSSFEDVACIKMSQTMGGKPLYWVACYLVDGLLVHACINGLPYLDLTVDPSPFNEMSCFPYPPTESYPYEDHLSYLLEYNTGTITIP